MSRRTLAGPANADSIRRTPSETYVKEPVVGARCVRAWALTGLAALAVSCGGGGGPPPFPTAQDRASVSIDPVEAARRSGAGDFAADYLRRTNFTSLVIEIDYPSGRPPSPAAVALLEQRVAERCDKPDGVIAIVDDAIPADQFDGVTSTADLDALERTWRDNYPDLQTHTAVMYFLYVKGQSDLGSGPTDILGITYHGSSVALYVDVANQGSDPFVTTAEVEGAGLVHESGHLLGLTNGTVPMLVDHQDRTHGSHDSHQTSIMYWLVKVPEVTPNLGDPSFAVFDALSIADLQAFGGLGPSTLGAGLPGPAPLGRTPGVDAAGADGADERSIVVGVCPHCCPPGLLPGARASR